MRFVYTTSTAAYDLSVDLEGADARVADLASALAQPDGRRDSGPGSGPDGGPERPGLFVDGLHHPGERPLSDIGLHEGAIVSLGPALRPDHHPPEWAPGVYVSVLTGVDAGSAVPVPFNGQYVVGRAAECHIRLTDPAVSRVHCRLTVDTAGSVTVVNESRTTGTRIAGQLITGAVTVPFGTPLLLGAVLIVVEHLGSEDQIRGADGAALPSTTVHVNRPPRADAMAAEGILDPPQEPENIAKPPFNAATMLAPVGMGVVMVVALGNILYGLMAVLSPVMALGNLWESKHRRSRNLRGSTRDYLRQLDAFGSTLSAARDQQVLDRRRATPGLPEILRRVALPSTRLWERRRGQTDFLRLGLGSADLPWTPPLASRRTALPDDVAALLTTHGVLFDVPLDVDLAGGGVVGIVGDRGVALALARSLVCQAAVLHGPADLRVAVAAADDPERVWDWAKWLPHTSIQTSGSERRLLAVGIDDTQDLFDSLIAEAAASAGAEASPPTLHVDPRGDQGPTTLYVIDGDALLSGRVSSARRLLSGAAGPAAGIVVAPRGDRLPALCTQIVTVEASGEATVVRLQGGNAPQSVRLGLLAAPAARRVAVPLSRFEDPELHVVGASLPGVLRLGTMLGVKAWDSEAVSERWRRAGTKRMVMRAPIGFAEDGQFDLDLDRHGPHGLIGGTTGSGKSELLKTLVASLAASYPPDQLTFGLFDFKGGATFTDFANLPHTVGMASDLDVSLARRALRCLRAELVYRERVFETAGVKDLAELNDRQSLGDAMAARVEVLPRLVVIIDEFAAMAKELAEEIGALADLTARGRSLGVHLLLATQKPSTAINSEIRTNTRLRISLQVEDRQDSLDVVGIPDAANINHKGRGYFRVGQGEVVPIQTAWSTGRVESAVEADLTIQAFTFAASPGPAPPAASSGIATELQTLVDAIGQAQRATGRPPQRRPWPDPLPERLTLDELAAIPIDASVGPDDVYFALADDPDRQTRYPIGWPMRSGNLLLFGVVGAGTTTALASVALSFARGGSPAERQIYVIDAGAGDLVPLEVLPHCASVIRAVEQERQVRLMRILTQELDRRRGLGLSERAGCPTILLVVDNLEGLRSTFENDPGPTWDRFVRMYADGPEAGVYVAASATRMGGVPSALSSVTPNKLLLRLSDIMEYGIVGLNRRVLPTFLPGRAIRPSDASVAQIAVPGASLAQAAAEVAATADASVVPAPIRSLPELVAFGELAGVTHLVEDRWDLAVGRRDDDLSPAVLSLYDAEHALVAGPARSGKSTALLMLAAALREADPAALVLGYGARRSPLLGAQGLDRCVSDAGEVGQLVDQALVSGVRTLLLIDDADLFDDPGGRVAALLTTQRPNLHVAAAGKADVLRSLYGHWTQTLRRSRAGLLLQPALDRDGELLGIRLPNRVAVPLTPGRGYLICGGNVDLVQTAS